MTETETVRPWDRAAASCGGCGYAAVRCALLLYLCARSADAVSKGYCPCMTKTHGCGCGGLTLLLAAWLISADQVLATFTFGLMSDTRVTPRLAVCADHRAARNRSHNARADNSTLLFWPFHETNACKTKPERTAPSTIFQTRARIWHEVKVRASDIMKTPSHYLTFPALALDCCSFAALAALP